MTDIVTAIAEGDSVATVKSRLVTIAETWLGDGAADGVANWGDMRALLNDVNPNVVITDGLDGAAVRARLDLINDYTAAKALLVGEPAGLVLDFTTNTAVSRIDGEAEDAFSGLPDGVGDFARASGATYFDADGVLQTAAVDELRMDYDADTGLVRGVLIEAAATNLLTYSEQFDNAAWTKVRSSITKDAITAPDGTLTADKLIEDTTASSTHGATSGTISIAKNVMQCLSFYVKAAERTKLFLQSNAFSGANITASFDLSTGTATNGTGAGMIEALADGWFRVALIGQPNPASSVLGVQCSIFLQDGSGNNAYTGDGTSGLYIWGAQIEAGSAPSSYIKTVAATATRSADIWDVPTSEFGFSAAEGTLLVEAMTPSTGGGGIVCLSPAASDTDVINITLSSGGGIGFYSQIASTSQLGGNFYSGAVAASTPFKAAFAYKQDDYAWKVSGKTLGTDTAADVPTVDTLRLGRRDLAGTWWNGWLRKVIYVPRRMSDAELTAWAA